MSGLSGISEPMRFERGTRNERGRVRRRAHDPGRAKRGVRMKPTNASPEEIEEGRRLVSMFRDRGLSEYEACMLAAQVQMAMRGPL